MSRQSKVPAPSPRSGFARSLAETASTLLLLLFGTTCLLQGYVIPTPSMEPTLLVGDHILADKLVYAPPDRTLGRLLPYDEIERGDIVVFVYPLDPNETYVKRAIGLPGDRLRIVNSQVFVNGKPLGEPYKRHIHGGGDPYLDSFPSEPYFAIPERGRAMLRSHVRDGELVIPAGAYFCMGDNRDNSADSRFWGFVPRENIEGSPAWIYWSYESTTERLLNRFGWAHWSDVAQNFFTKTRWERTLDPVR